MWGGEYEASFHSVSDRRRFGGGESTRLGGVNEITAGKASLSWRGCSKLCQKLFTFVSWMGFTVSGGGRGVFLFCLYFLLFSFLLFSLRRGHDAVLRSRELAPEHWFWLRMCTFQHPFPSTRAWNLNEWCQQHNVHCLPLSADLKTEHLCPERTQNSRPSHLEELTTVVAEAHTWTSTTQPVSSHLQVSIEHTPYQNKWPGCYYLRTVISVVWNSQWCRLVKCWKSLIAIKVLVMYTYKVYKPINILYYTACSQACPGYGALLTMYTTFCSYLQTYLCLLQYGSHLKKTIHLSVTHP